MYYPLFIAGRLSRSGKGGFTSLVLRISLIGISLSTAVMLLSFATVNGFKKEIIEKITGFDGDLIVKKYESGQTLEGSFFPASALNTEELRKVPGVKDVFPVCSKAGIVRAAQAMEGLVFKGVNAAYQGSFLSERFVKGSFPDFSTSETSYGIIISEVTANRLFLDTGDRLDAFFIEQGQIRRRRFRIEGMYSTGLAEHDQTFALCDLRVIQRLISINLDTLSGVEIVLQANANSAEIKQNLYPYIPTDLRVETSEERNFNLYEWLGYLDTNVVVILSLMFFVAAVNMSSGIFVLIIERTRMIGILKSLGAHSAAVLRIFMYFGIRLLLGGMLIGNALAGGIILVQNLTGFLKLDEEIYYLDRVPFRIEWTEWLMINAGVVILCIAILMLPVFLIQKIRPAQTLRFD